MFFYCLWQHITLFHALFLALLRFEEQYIYQPGERSWYIQLVQKIQIPITNASVTASSILSVKLQMISWNGLREICCTNCIFCIKISFCKKQCSFQIYQSQLIETAVCLFVVCKAGCTVLTVATVRTLLSSSAALRSATGRSAVTTVPVLTELFVPFVNDKVQIQHL